MKQSQSAEKYVDDIIKELPPSPHTSRFREELLEHMSDAEEDLSDRENDLNQIRTTIMDKIGDKDTLVKSYKNFYKNCCSRFWPIELCIYMIISEFVYIATIAIMEPYSLITDCSFWILNLIIISLSVALGYALNYAFFRFVAKRLLPHVSGKRGRFLLALSLVVLPVLLFVLAFVFIILMAEDASVIKPLFMNILPLTTVLTADGIVFGIIPRPKIKTPLDSTKIPYMLLCLLLATMFGSVLLAKQESGNLSAPWQFLDATITFLAMPVGFVYGAVSFTAPDPITEFRIFAALLIMIVSGSVLLFMSAAKAKTASSKSWRRAAGIALVVYSAYVILPFDKMRDAESGWNVPAINIDREIMKIEQGPLYNAKEFALQGDVPGGATEVCRDGDKFTIAQSHGIYDSPEVFYSDSDYFLIDVSNVPEGQTPEVSVKEERTLGPCTQEFILDEKTYPEGFECADCRIEIAHSDSIPYFTNLTYNGHKVFDTDTDSQIEVYEVKLSANQEWALIEITSNNYKGQVYLLDLRNLK